MGFSTMSTERQFLSIAFRSALLSLLLVPLLTGCARQTPHPAPPVRGDEVVIDIADLPLDVPQFFTLDSGKRNVSFFVVRLSTSVQSYFDACVSCYAQKKGYVADNRRVICRACGTSYSIHKLSEGIGGCYPLQIKGRLEDGTYRIRLSTISSEASKF